jgi:uncharacterized protein (DUF2147 family)
MTRILSNAATLAMAVALIAGSAAAQARGAIEGQWRNAKGSVVVKVDQCGEAWCATVVDASAKAKASARRGGTPQLVGTQILSGVRPTGSGLYRGRAFDPKRNLRAAATIRFVNDTTIVIKGCLVSGIICKEQRWTKIG